MTSLTAIADHWEAIKNGLVPHDANLRALIHVHGAMALFVVLACFSRRGLASQWPLLAVVGITLLNEGADLIKLGGLRQSWIYWDTGLDIFNSVIWPLLIVLAARFLERRRRR